MKNFIHCIGILRVRYFPEVEYDTRHLGKLLDSNLSLAFPPSEFPKKIEMFRL